MKPNLLFVILALIGLVFSESANAQEKTFEPLKDTVPRGVSISPPTIRFALKPGTSQSKQIKISNDTDLPRTFQVKVQDYLASDINRSAENSNVPDDYKYGLNVYPSPAMK